MRDTRPEEVNRRAAYEADKAVSRVDVDNDRDYRENAIRTMTRIEVKLESLTADFREHVHRDEKSFESIARQFGAVTQNIGDTIDSKKIAIWLAGATAATALVYFIIQIVEKVAK